jgi:NADH-quinone oxidoreductase subunit G
MNTFITTIDNIKVLTSPYQTSLYQVFSSIYYSVAHFCYNKKLFISGNCRLCLVEIKGMAKPIISCAIPVTKDLEVFTSSPLVLKAQENILEFLLINHPLDCPICDQGGACDLQEFSYNYGQGISRFFFKKSTTGAKNIDSLLKTSMNRCINCTKCIRLSYYLGIYTLSLFGRSLKSEITYINFKKLNKTNSHELFLNITTICPVGFLNSILK